MAKKKKLPNNYGGNDDFLDGIVVPATAGDYLIVGGAGNDRIEGQCR